VGLGAQILREGELVIGRRFDLRQLAEQSAEEEQKEMDRRRYAVGKGSEKHS